MSADNYLYIREVDGEFWLTMEFASSSPGAYNRGGALQFSTLEHALAYAGKAGEECEYGTIVAGTDDEAWLEARKDMDRRAVERVVQRFYHSTVAGHYDAPDLVVRRLTCRCGFTSAPRSTWEAAGADIDDHLESI